MLATVSLSVLDCNTVDAVLISVKTKKRREGGAQ